MASASRAYVTALRKELKYGETNKDSPRYALCLEFCKDLEAFRKAYKTPLGLSGQNLYNQRSSQHRQGLKDLVTTFLNNEGRGEQYWPSEATSPYFSGLRYSEQDKQ